MLDYEVPTRIFFVGVGCLFICFVFAHNDWRILAAGVLGTVAGGIMIHITARRRAAEAKAQADANLAMLAELEAEDCAEDDDRQASDTESRSHT